MTLCHLAIWNPNRQAEWYGVSCRKAFIFQLCGYSNPYLWFGTDRDMTERLQMQVAEISFHHRVAGLSHMLRHSDIWRELRVQLFFLHWKVFQASDEDASRVPAFGGFLRTSNRDPSRSGTRWRDFIAHLVWGRRRSGISRLQIKWMII